MKNNYTLKEVIELKKQWKEKWDEQRYPKVPKEADQETIDLYNLWDKVVKYAHGEISHSKIIEIQKKYDKKYPNEFGDIAF